MATTAKAPSEEIPEAFSFSDLISDGRSAYPHIKTLDGKRVEIKALGTEDQGKTYYVTLLDDTRFSVPPTLAKKIASALDHAGREHKAGKVKTANVRAQVQALDRGVRLA